MLVALEGPDRVGKTTLFDALQGRIDAVFVPCIPMAAELMPFVDLLEPRTVALWKALYDPSKLYISDRCPFVSNIVYAQVYGRSPRSYPDWYEEVSPVYLRAPARVLRARPADALPQDYDAVLRVYDRVVTLFATGLILDATMPLEKQIGRVVQHVGDLRNAGRIR
jgi:hypothetical protein